jgi:hypothetical protein
MMRENEATEGQHDRRHREADRSRRDFVRALQSLAATPATIELNAATKIEKL